MDGRSHLERKGGLRRVAARLTPISGVAVLLISLVGASSAGAIGLLGGWGDSGAGPGEFGFPVAVATDTAGGNVYVADSENNRIQRFSAAGKFIGEWGSSGSANGEFATPQSVATDGDGNVYVADADNFRIQKFTGGGDFLTAWGSSGSGPGQFSAPEGVATDTAGNVYVADAQNDRIEKFSSSGTFLTQWGSSGKGPGEFGFPIAVATDSAGKIYVADSENDRIETFTGSGDFLTQWGGPGSGPGELDFPVDVAAAASGRVYVADAHNDRIQIFGKLPQPKFGKTVNVGVVSGKVRVRLAGTHRFVELVSELQIPVGSSIDTTAGRVRLKSAKNGNGELQAADFYRGRFNVQQPRTGKPITVLVLEGAIGPCHGGRHGRASASRGGGRRLWGSGHGNFRSEGKHGSATVRGTIWLTRDSCQGTFFRVKRGVVTVKDFTLHRTVKIRRGKHYLAPAR